MAEIGKTFINDFHNLPGITIKEKQNNFFNLLNQNISLKKNPEELDYITKNLEPSNYLEKILHVDFLIYFERFDELYEKFKRGEDITVRKVSKHEWFFQKAFKDVGVEEFVDKILPSTPHSIKVTILRKLPVENQQADEFFDAVCNRYGLFLATNLIQKCTAAKIREIMSTQPVKATEAQLQTIYNKDPDLMPLYFEQRTKNDGNSSFFNNNGIVIYIAQKNPKMFTQLFNKYKFRASIGRRTTKKFLDCEKEEVLKQLEVYMKILDKSAIIRKLGQNVIDSLLKKQAGGENVEWRSLLRHFPKKKRFKAYRSAHDQVYRCSLADNVEEMCEEDFELMDDNEERVGFAMKKMKKQDDDNYLKYVKPDYCLQKFMEKVNHMKSPERAKYVGIATYCCILNKDYDNFLKVADLVCVRFKNDDSSVRQSFFSNFINNTKAVNDLKEEHWKIIMDIYAIAKAKRDYLWNENEIIGNYLKFLILNDDFEKMKEIVRKDYDWYYIISYNNCFKDAKIFKPVINELIDIGKVKPDPDEELDSPRFDCMLVSLCAEFNKRCPKDTVDVFNHPRILDSVKKMLELETSTYIDEKYMSGVRNIVCQLTQSTEIQQLKQLYFKAFNKFGDTDGIRWFLKNEPRVLLEYYDDFLKKYPDCEGTHNPFNTKGMWRMLKKYSHLELDTKAVEYFKQHLKDEIEDKDKLIIPMTLLVAPSSYLEFIVESFSPTKDKVDLTDEDEQKLYHLQGKLFKFLHYVNCPAEVAPIALNFCKGDYLQFALGPLYSSIYKLPQNETEIYIEKLQESKAISVKKHALNLSCVIYDKDTICQRLETSTVPCTAATLKYFAKNPSTALWNLFANRVTNIKKKELSALKPTVDVVVPFEYKSQYVEMVWKVIDKYERKDFKKTLLNKIDYGTIQNFSPDFAVGIIKSSIFKLEEANDFVTDLLVHVKSEEKFTVMAEILNAYKTNCWDVKESQRLARRKMTKFIQKLFQKYMAAEEPDQKFAPEFTALYKSVFPLTEACEDWILVSLMALKNSTPEDCALVLSELNQLLNEKYGKYTINMLATLVKNFAFKHTFKFSGEKIKLCHALLKKGGIVNDQILLLKFLPRTEPKDKENFALYDEIITTLEKSTDETVQLQFGLFLKDDPNGDDNKEINWGLPCPRLCR